MSQALPDPAEAMQTRLRADLRVAMKARETLEISLLRGLIAAIDNAQSAGIQAGPAASATPAASSEWVAAGGAFGSGEVARKVLSEADLAALLAVEADTRELTAVEMDRVGRADLAAVARAEGAILARYRD